MGVVLGKQRVDIFLAPVLRVLKAETSTMRGGKLMDSFAPQTFCCGKMPNGMSLGACGVMESLESFHRGLSQRLVFESGMW